MRAPNMIADSKSRPWSSVPSRNIGLAARRSTPAGAAQSARFKRPQVERVVRARPRARTAPRRRRQEDRERHHRDRRMAEAPRDVAVPRRRRRMRSEGGASDRRSDVVHVAVSRLARESRHCASRVRRGLGRRPYASSRRRPGRTRRASLRLIARRDLGRCVGVILQATDRRAAPASPAASAGSRIRARSPRRPRSGTRRRPRCS